MRLRGRGRLRDPEGGGQEGKGRLRGKGPEGGREGGGGRRGQGEAGGWGARGDMLSLIDWAGQSDVWFQEHVAYSGHHTASPSSIHGQSTNVPVACISSINCKDVISSAQPAARSTTLYWPPADKTISLVACSASMTPCVSCFAGGSSLWGVSWRALQRYSGLPLRCSSDPCRSPCWARCSRSWRPPASWRSRAGCS